MEFHPRPCALRHLNANSGQEDSAWSWLQSTSMSQDGEGLDFMGKGLGHAFSTHLEFTLCVGQ